jgi:hypothetical protein
MLHYVQNIPEPSQKDIFHVTTGYAMNAPLRKGLELAFWPGRILITEYMVEDLAQHSRPQIEARMRTFNYTLQHSPITAVHRREAA